MVILHLACYLIRSNEIDNTWIEGDKYDYVEHPRIGAPVCSTAFGP